MKAKIFQLRHKRFTYKTFEIYWWRDWHLSGPAKRKRYNNMKAQHFLVTAQTIYILINFEIHWWGAGMYTHGKKLMN